MSIYGEGGTVWDVEKMKCGKKWKVMMGGCMVCMEWKKGEWKERV